MLGNNSCGVHSLLAATHGLGLRTSDNTAELDILTYDGRGLHVGPTTDDALEANIGAGGRRGAIYAALPGSAGPLRHAIRERFPKLPRRVSGYNLDELLPEHGFNVARALVGTEGTCVTILEATLHLVPNPGGALLLVLGYEDVFKAADHSRCAFWNSNQRRSRVSITNSSSSSARKATSRPIWISSRMAVDGCSWSSPARTATKRHEKARACQRALRGEPDPPAMRDYENPEDEKKIWAVRESGLGATAWVPGQPDLWPGWEDSAVAPETCGRVSARSPQALRPVRLPTVALWPLRAGVHPLPRGLRPLHGATAWRSIAPS